MGKNNLLIRIIGYYSIFLGISVLTMWIKILLNETIPEGKTEMSFHLFSEFLMASICLSSGLLLVIFKYKGLKSNIMAHSMIVYSLINAMGYYAERDEKSTIVLFIILALLSFLILAYHLFLAGKP